MFLEKSFSLDGVYVFIKSGKCCSRTWMENDLEGDTRNYSEFDQSDGSKGREKQTGSRR